MLGAWKEGCTSYEPVVQGLNLGVEISDPKTSLDNLSLLLDSGRKVISMHAGPSGVFIVFSSWETYLATGFSFRTANEVFDSAEEERRAKLSHPLCYLARFCSLVTGGEVADWLDYLWTWEPNFQGEIELCLAPKGTRLVAFTGDEPQEVEDF